MDHGEHSSGDRGSDPVTSSGAFRIIGSGGAHGIGREMLCSLPRAVSCRVCFGEKDCPYIVERPYGRLVVHKRPPTDLVVRHAATVATGSRNPLGTWTPLWQKAAALLAWTAVPLLIWWNWIAHRPPLMTLALPAALLLATFAATVVGVPLVRWTWRDHGGSRRGGPWRPS